MESKGFFLLIRLTLSFQSFAIISFITNILFLAFSAILFFYNLLKKKESLVDVKPNFINI